ncbi:hypothetical protein F1D05_28590 [Kribbella qitaiheensis]|uniref:Uncharacterized protein n=1 Tax=Kribbella qitaiheensis TaxID=1544730 RepID=A0A7G6X4I2_9ACTN|nr:hypothetical protein [Kribbella qitaiheensis]QNE21147.1 hypothetical protein F1D05_28590 [Kribbella qitaiheensis]
MIALHLGGVPELAMFLGPILLIVAFVRIARRNESRVTDDEDDWDADLGDLAEPPQPNRPQPNRRSRTP